MKQIIIANGYVVQAYFRCSLDTHEKWHSIRNFGDRQSDAIEYLNDIENVEEYRLNSLAKAYSPDVKYIRMRNGYYRRQ